MQGPETRASLLLRLRDRDQELVWSEFIAIYEPVIYRFARGKGLQDADALDVCQDVFVSVEKSISDFDPERGGTFRGWLFKIARNTLINRLSRDRNTAGSGRTTAMLQLRELPNRDTKLSSEVDEQLRREIFQWAAARVQSRVSQIAWQVFWLSGVQQQSDSLTAKQFNKSEGAIRIMRCRVLAQLRTEVKKYDG